MSNLFDDLETQRREMLENTGMTFRDIDKMTDEEKLAWAKEGLRQYAQQLYLLGYNSSQVVAMVKYIFGVGR